MSLYLVKFHVVFTVHLVNISIVIYKLKAVWSCMQLSQVGSGFPVLCCYEFCVVVCTGWLRCDLCWFVLQWLCHRYLHRIAHMRVVGGGVNDLKLRS